MLLVTFSSKCIRFSQFILFNVTQFLYYIIKAFDIFIMEKKNVNKNISTV